MAVLSALTVKLVATGLSVSLAGTYNSAYGFLQIFAILADFGLYAVSINELSRTQEKERVLGALLTIRVTLTVLSLGAAIVLAWLLPMWQGTPLPLAISIASLVPFLTLLAGVLRTVFQITYTMHTVFIAEVLQRLVTVLLMVWVLMDGLRGSTDPDTLMLFLWLGVAGSVALFLISFFGAVRRMRVRPSFVWGDIRPLLTRAMPYGVAFLCIALYRQFDLTMIAMLRDDFQLQNARYGFALRVAEMTYLVPTFLLNSTLPLLSTKLSDGQSVSSLLRKTFLTLLFLGLFSSIFAFFWARPLMQLFTDTVYLATNTAPGADTALMLLAPSMFLNMIVLFSFYTLLSTHKWRLMLVPMVIAVVLSVFLNITFIPAFGFIGSAVTLIVVHLLLACSLLPLSLRAAPFAMSVSDYLRLLGFGIGIALIAMLLVPLLTTTLSIIISGVVAIALVGSVALLLKLPQTLR